MTVISLPFSIEGRWTRFQVRAIKRIVGPLLSPYAAELQVIDVTTFADTCSWSLLNITHRATDRPLSWKVVP